MLLPGFSEKPSPAGVCADATQDHRPGCPRSSPTLDPITRGEEGSVGHAERCGVGGSPLALGSPQLYPWQKSAIFPSRVADSSADLEGWPVRGPAPREPPAQLQHRPRPQRAQRWADALLGGLQRTPSSSPRGPGLPGIFFKQNPERNKLLFG